MFRSLVVITASAFALGAADNPPNVHVVEEIAAKVNGDIITRGELEKHKADYRRKESQVFLSQIVISTEGKNPEQLAAAEKKAKDVAARAKKGEKFSDLARDNSDDVETAKNGGYIGAMPRGTMDKA